MISFHYELDFKLKEEASFKIWIDRIANSEEFQIGNLQFIFCDDDYLLDLHRKYLAKDSLTDIISFDYTKGRSISGDIFISIERVRENAAQYEASFSHELMRVMAHGVLHLMSYDDKIEEEREMMRKKEDEKIRLFHVEQ